MPKLALPKGRLMALTASLLEGLGLEGYSPGSRSYRLESQAWPRQVGAKVFQEKDIPIQVAVGNYDLGICGSHWVDELLAKFPSSDLVKIRSLGYGRGELSVAASPHLGISSLEELKWWDGHIRLASEYPNTAESLALRLRLRRFLVYPLWGAAEAYPPENADLVIVSNGNGAPILSGPLVPLARLGSTEAVLVANRKSWGSQDLARVLQAICEGVDRVAVAEETVAKPEMKPNREAVVPVDIEAKPGQIWLALPDGHQQPPMARLLQKAGFPISGYSETECLRRPVTEWKGIGIKVIRPQDMPLQVAAGNFDLAITGRDWLRDHLARFPSSPVQELLDLGLGWVRLVAVVTEETPVQNISELRRLVRSGSFPRLRIASEYTNLADKYAWDNHLSPYRLIPTWGASEAFLPEDADLLIENTQTGRTLAEHKLKIIDTLFESTACLIGNRDSLSRPAKARIMHDIAAWLKSAL